MNAATVNHQWRIAAFPQGEVRDGDLRWSESPVPEISENQILVRNIYLSLDPTNRLWASGEETYLPPLKLGDVMRGSTLGVVEKTRHPRFREGDVVMGAQGWQVYAVSDGSDVSRLPRDNRLPLKAYMGVIGSIGLTAYFGLLDVGRPKAGETVLISAAAGAVGSLVGQIAKIQGCRVVGIAGSEEKCRWIVDTLGFDAAINYRSGDLAQAISRSCPSGVDVYFDNVGGDILDAAMGALNLYGRIVVCGLISQYNAASPQHTFSNLTHFLIKRVRMEAFIVLDYLARAHEAYAPLTQWLQEGRIQYRVDIMKGLENAPAALAKLFDGSNQGKQLLLISDEP
ncbi:MAG: putative NADP-dependent oxidoreductase [Hydrocarboniphaga sp.]|uniref:NADP-dependent oxidoreductase n=1 Tax=Hydrocarboniphaga sp. TaxID=2033016 RepID=UPI0026258264|nr:NADP-dependent oxidoreductase [Hydrocarboniphaga sp.]MDB5969949.1 putative NADP-dependent oxidoreductase [Hydrocarboniphaga sp.]